MQVALCKLNVRCENAEPAAKKLVGEELKGPRRMDMVANVPVASLIQLEWMNDSFSRFRFGYR